MTIYKAAAMLLVWCVPALSLIACSDSDSDGGTSGAVGASGVQGSKQFGALSDAEKMMLCDFAAAKFGGYGKSVDCGDGTTLDSTYADQAECVADAPKDCSLTVSQYEQCINDQSCADLLPDSCAPLFQCS